MKAFLGALIGSFIGTGIVLAFAANHFAPMIVLPVAAAQKILGPAEAERLVREKLGREWHAGE